MSRRSLISLALLALIALPLLSACDERGAYPWEESVMKDGRPARVAVLPFVGRMDVRRDIERAVAQFFEVHKAALTPGVTYMDLPRVAEPEPFPENAAMPSDILEIVARIFFDDSKARLYDILDKTGHDYAIYIQADKGVGSAQYIVSVFDAAARRNTSENRNGFSRNSDYSDQEVQRAIELCFSRLAER